MDNKYEILDMLHQKHNYEQKLSSMIYGSIEVRTKDLNKYIYIHYRENGKLYTKYIGEYTDDLYNLIFNNNIESKRLKKEIRTLNKKLKELNYNIDKKKMKIDNSINTLGTHIVEVELYKNIKANLNVILKEM